MAHAQKPDFVFRRNRGVHLNRQGRQFSRLLGSRGVGIRCSNAEYTMFRGSAKGTVYPLCSPVSTSLPLPCVTVSHHISTGVSLSMFKFDIHLRYSSAFLSVVFSFVHSSTPWHGIYLENIFPSHGR